jgi:hypothetical protein
MAGRANQSFVVVFVEGETDFHFFNKLFEYYKQTSMTPMRQYKIVSVKGVSHFPSRVKGKLKGEIIPNAKEKELRIVAVCCCYDTDVFEFSERPPVNWKSVKSIVNSLGIKNFIEVKVDHMLEDWLLDDIDGLCTYLKLESSTIHPGDLPGKNGYEKIQNLFRRAKKVYLKGDAAKRIMDNLDFAKIRAKRQKRLSVLEKILNVNI